MCLIIFAYRQHPAYRLVLAANRDEFYARRTAPLQRWPEAPEIVAGRDLEAGGTWLGVTEAGRFAAVTNYRDARPTPKDAPSRGLLTADYLRSGDSPRAYLDRLASVAGQYGGFNLLVGDTQELCYFSNRQRRTRPLTPGLYGLSNHLLDTPWPKVERGKDGLRRLIDKRRIDASSVLELLTDGRAADDAMLPDTGVGLATERMLSPVCISGERYGTRSSSVLVITHDGAATLTERSLDDTPGQIRTLALEPAPARRV